MILKEEIMGNNLYEDKAKARGENLSQEIKLKDLAKFKTKR